MAWHRVWSPVAVVCLLVGVLVCLTAFMGPTPTTIMIEPDPVSRPGPAQAPIAAVDDEYRTVQNLGAEEDVEEDQADEQPKRGDRDGDADREPSQKDETLLLKSESRVSSTSTVMPPVMATSPPTLPSFAPDAGAETCAENVVYDDGPRAVAAVVDPAVPEVQDSKKNPGGNENGNENGGENEDGKDGRGDPVAASLASAVSSLLPARDSVESVNKIKSSSPQPSPIESQNPSVVSETATATFTPIIHPPWNESHYRPQAFIIGEQKCGTTALFEMLSFHGQFRRPTRKEVCFFTTVGRGKNMTFNEYVGHFPVKKPSDVAGSFTMDACTNYIMDKLSPRRLHEFDPKSKLILLVRHPVDRFESAFNYGLRANWSQMFEILNGTYDVNFLADVLLENTSRGVLIKQGYYLENLNRFLEYFPAEQILVILNEDMATQGRSVIRSVLRFLEIPDFYFDHLLHIRFNQRREPPNLRAKVVTTLDDDHRQRLFDHYQSRNEEFFRYLGIPNPWTKLTMKEPKP